MGRFKSLILHTHYCIYRGLYIINSTSNSLSCARQYLIHKCSINNVLVSNYKCIIFLFHLFPCLKSCHYQHSGQYLQYFNVGQRFSPRNPNLLAFIGYSGSCCISVTSFLKLHLQYFIAGQLDNFHLQRDAVVVSVKMHSRQLFKNYPHLHIWLVLLSIESCSAFYQVLFFSHSSIWTLEFGTLPFSTSRATRTNFRKCIIYTWYTFLLIA